MVPKGGNQIQITLYRKRTIREGPSSIGSKPDCHDCSSPAAAMWGGWEVVEQQSGLRLTCTGGTDGIGRVAVDMLTESGHIYE
ncbi:hypothetical protein FUA23_12235 [Neolewinella aurantiaca]|uniref:Uncharacterized protein n=1 Tax=Neolewinella aurantiaca TaxID=2602767 RepID=A0A5C7FFJ7_9BACT|nr:hypothetical protein [Neolewinella aurantiaca]TXF89048.1 hypothetical protein FUA23_12235 [Neolewinella aurantiaca]